MPVRTPYSASNASAVAARSALPGPPQYPFTDSSIDVGPRPGRGHRARHGQTERVVRVQADRHVRGQRLGLGYQRGERLRAHRARPVEQGQLA